MWLDRWVMVCLIPLAAWVLVSGIDDLFIALVSLLPRRIPFPWPEDGELERAGQRRIAVFVPLWQEHRVIGQMLEHNLAAIHYANYDLFVGVYPNDPPTVRAVAEAAARDPRIHPARLSHNGPTSKADCLNSIYRQMCDYEMQHDVRFEIVMLHDAEDLIHPESLRLVNWFSRDFQMVQIPVLALPTPLREFTHGLYCDEFAEFQSKDIPVRQRLGGFLPGNGVGTGFERAALERLAEERATGVFDPECLTEDYETGCRLHELGYRQLFVPLRFCGAGPVATREYFPRRFRSAVRQRSRWVAGIALQGWERHGWRVPWQQIYWFWRDRKGLVGALLSPAANLAFLYGLSAPESGFAVPHWVSMLCTGTLAVAATNLGIRVATSTRVYGARFAALVPLRVLWGNLVNFAATLAAVRLYVEARLRRQHPAWRKTEHVYPAHSPHEQCRPRIGEVLVRMHAVSLEAVEKAAAELPDGFRLGEYLMFLQQLSEDNLYCALSLQAGIPMGVPAADEVSRLATRALPAQTARRWKVLPYRINLGQLHLITTEQPCEEMTRDLQTFSHLELRFRLVRPAEFQRLARKYLPK